MMTGIESAYANYLNRRRETGLLRELCAIERPSAREVIADGRYFVNFASNDYLGLGHHPALAAGAEAWMLRSGAGSGASRLVTGNLEPFGQLEARLARFKGKEASLILASGFQANVSVLEAILDRNVLGVEPLVFADRLNHASMHLGCAAAGVRQIRYRHCDVAHLQALLEKDKGKEGPRFILTESVFSMDGDRAPLDRITELARAYECCLIVDDAHAAGILGAKGSGLAQDADIVIGTFSKAFGSFGAYVGSSQIICDYLINRCKGLIYSTALPPQVLGAIDAALDLIPDLDDARSYVLGLAEQFRTSAKTLGLDIGASDTQIVPVIVHDPQAAEELSAHLRTCGLWATAIRPPSVPQGTARLRIAFSAEHKADDLDRLVQGLREWQKMRTRRDEKTGAP